jgi:predicted nucleic acid-binding protein
MIVLVDASALVPMQIMRDQHSARLSRIVIDLIGRGTDLVTTNWTLYEALALANRYGHPQALELFRRVASFAATHSVDEDIERESLRRFLNWKDKSASVVDHANLLVAARTGCSAILSFDDDFAPLVRQAGLQLLR